MVVSALFPRFLLLAEGSNSEETHGKVNITDLECELLSNNILWVRLENDRWSVRSRQHNYSICLYRIFNVL